MLLSFDFNYTQRLNVVCSTVGVIAYWLHKLKVKLLTLGFDSESKNFLLSPLAFVSFCAE